MIDREVQRVAEAQHAQRKLAVLDRLDAVLEINRALMLALAVITDHAGEKYPHFESERGQRDIEAAHAALAQARGEK